MSQHIGIVMIGTSPRPDIISEVRNYITEDVEINQVGALDGFYKKDLEFTEIKKQEELVTRLQDGSEIHVPKSFILPKMQQKVDKLNETSVDLITLLCSGSFPKLKSDLPLVYPHKLIYGTLESIGIKRNIGIIVPSASQIDSMKKDFEDHGFSTVCTSASPYSDEDNQLEIAARDLCRKEVDLILLNCFGYSLEMKRLVSEACGVPVILVRSLLGRTLGELSS
ncbi:AroM family protein [Candidatus Bipolaricaulota bacterium]|nr:AroM family protein [Candidatus Bipolaricaulota bacterium]